MEETPQEFTDYELTEVSDPTHVHTFEPKGKDALGWNISQCACGAGKASPENIEV